MAQIVPLYFFIDSFSLLPYYRMTQKTKFYTAAQRYLGNRSVLRLLMSNVLSLNNISPSFDSFYFPSNLSLQSIVYINQVSISPNKCDLDNLVKSLFDCCQGFLFPNDRFIDSIYSKRSFNTDLNDFLAFAIGPSSLSFSKLNNHLLSLMVSHV